MKIIKILCLFLVFTSSMEAQTEACVSNEVQGVDPTSCCNDLIISAPINPVNTEYPELTNQFDWLAPTQQLPNPQTLAVNIGNSLVNAEHPFLLDLTHYYWFSSYRNGQVFPLETHNMHPRYGWELMHLNLGLGLFGDEVENNTGQFNPYMLFYNKYTGKLRMLTSPGAGLSFDDANVDISIFTSISEPGLKLSALLNRYNEQQLALDQPSAVTMVSSHLPFTTPNKWSIADFQLEYDPCTCNLPSRLNFKFTERNFSAIDMYGRLVGREVPLSTSGNSPLAFGDDFLSSVYLEDINDDQKGKAGMLVYNQIAQDVESAYVSDAMKFYSTMLDVAGLAIKGYKIPFPLGNGDTIGLPAGAAAAAGVGFASKQLNPPAPNITYLEAEMTLTGEIDDVSNSGGLANIEILSPGSFTADHSLVPWTQHAFYNELPGLFALLRTPNIQWAHDWGEATNPALGGFGVALEEPLEYVLNPAAEIDIENTKIYAAIEFDVYSPFTEPLHIVRPDIYGDSYDGDQTDPIIADFVGLPVSSIYSNFDTPTTYDATHSMAKILEPSFTLAWMELLVNTELLEKYPVLTEYSTSIANTAESKYTTPGYDTKLTFQTALVPIDKIHELRFTEKFQKLAMNHSHWDSAIPALTELWNFRLKIVANYTFLPNAYGETNKTTQVYTYKFGDKTEISFNTIDICSNQTNPVCDTNPYNQYDYEEFKTLYTTHFTTSQDIYADYIFIIGELTTAPGVVVNLYAATEIRLIDVTEDPNFPGIDDLPSVSPDIHLIIREMYPHGNQVIPVSETNVKAFCLSNDYTAGAAQFVSADDKVASSNSENERLKYSLYPNPVDDVLNLNLKVKSDSNLSIRIFDLSGKELKSVSSSGGNLNTDTQLHQISTSDLPTGLFLFEICLDGLCATEKISVIH